MICPGPASQSRQRPSFVLLYCWRSFVNLYFRNVHQSFPHNNGIVIRLRRECGFYFVLRELGFLFVVVINEFFLIHSYMQKWYLSNVEEGKLHDCTYILFESFHITSNFMLPRNTNCNADELTSVRQLRIVNEQMIIFCSSSICIQYEVMQIYPAARCSTTKLSNFILIPIDPTPKWHWRNEIIQLNNCNCMRSMCIGVRSEKKNMKYMRIYLDAQQMRIV